MKIEELFKKAEKFFGIKDSKSKKAKKQIKLLSALEEKISSIKQKIKKADSKKKKKELKKEISILKKLRKDCENGTRESTKWVKKP